MSTPHRWAHQVANETLATLQRDGCVIQSITFHRPSDEEMSDAICIVYNTPNLDLEDA